MRIDVGAVVLACLVALAGTIDQATAQQQQPVIIQKLPPIEVITNSKRVTTQISIIRTGILLDTFGIVTVNRVENPGNCKTPADGYWTDINQPGYHTYYAAALLAFAQHATVEVVVFGCLGDRPHLVGLDILR
jgi:hypothetical protein